MAEEIKLVPTPVNPIEIKGAIAFSANHARIWAEGTDEEVETLGGEHSAKGWADYIGGEGKAYTDEQIAIAKNELSGQITAASQGAVSTANSYTDEQISLEESARQNADSILQINIDNEAETRISADEDLQSQIDALAAASDVTDIVGTYADLEAYDTTQLKDNDIIKVLSDSTHSGASTYYRWDKETEEFSYIGSEGPYYTKSESDSKFLTQTDAASTYATQSALSSKQDTLVSGTNIKTVNGNSLLGSGNVSIDTLPSQSGNNGKFLTTNGIDASWATVDTLPSQTGQNGKFLTTDGTDASWATVDTLPSQSGQSGKFLTTDGTDASWASVSVPANVYTQDNLVAGTNISLTEQTISGGIDEHTLALFHVEENWTDSSQYASTGFGGYGQTNGCSFVDARFGKGAKKRATSNFFNSAFQNISTAFTIDFWAKIAWNEIVKVNLCYNVYGTEAGYLRISRSQADIPSQSSTDIYVRLMAAGVETSPILIQNAIDINDFNHYAFCVDTTTQSIKLFINGVEKYSTATTSSIPTFTTNPYFYFDSGANFSETIIDEFRISNVARYTGDFTQPTAPYTSGSTTVTAINNTMSAPSVMTGATSGAAGTSGLVPAPAAGDQAKYLTGAGTWEQPSSSVPTLHYITNQTGTSITIPDTSSARKVKVYKNGILLDRLSDNYSISGTTLTISPALELADTITLEVY